jgi:hypothetical protein
MVRLVMGGAFAFVFTMPLQRSSRINGTPKCWLVIVVVETYGKAPAPTLI